MFKLNGIKLGAALLLLSGTVNASVIISNQQIPDEDILSISISPGTGTLLINTKVDYDVMRSDGSSTPPPPAGDVAITTFVASPTSFVEGGSTTISWQTQNAASCETANGTASWLTKNVSAASSSTSIQIANTGSYGFTLICKDASNVAVTKNLTVSVTAAPVTGGTTCGSTALNGKTETWAELWGAEFPGPAAGQKIPFITRNGYNAYRFNTGNVNDNGTILSINSTYSPGVRKGSISECPGDFNVPAACQHTWGYGGGIKWATDGKLGACNLEPNKDYYLNITFTDGTDPASATCTGTCETILQYAISR